MNILVLIKQVPDTEANITVSGGKINEAGIKWIISPYDEIALEEAIRIKEKTGSTVTALSVGTENNINALRTCYAMGADKPFWCRPTNMRCWILSPQPRPLSRPSAGTNMNYPGGHPGHRFR